MDAFQVLWHLTDDQILQSMLDNFSFFEIHKEQL